MEFHVKTILIQGQAGVGKTTVKHMLYGEPLERLRTSTPLAEPPDRIYVPKDSNQQKSGIDLGSLNMPELEKLVNDVVSAFIAKNQKEGEYHSPLSKDRKTDPTSESSSLPLSHFQKALVNAHNRMVAPAVPRSIHSASKLDEVTRSAASDSLGSNWIFLMDSGGQPQFHNLLPHFVQGISVVIFVLRLSERLEDHLMVEYYDNGEQIGVSYRSALSTEDTLKCLVRSTQSHITSDGQKPKLLFIGTFHDQMDDCSETLAEKNAKLCKLLSPEFIDQLIFVNRHLEELIFPLNATSHGPFGKEMVAKIQWALESYGPFQQINVSSGWYVLEVTLKKLSNKLGRLILTMQECLTVARELGISQDALIKGLELLHQFHIFHFYPKFLPEIVFTSTQVLLDKVTELVREAYEMRSDQSVSMNISKGSDLPKIGGFQKLRDLGIITLELLEQFPKYFMKDVFSASDLLKIFKHHLIIAPLSKDQFHCVTDHDYNSRSMQYFMPSLLNMLSPDDLESIRVFCSPAEPLLIQLPSGWPRAGVFCCLQVYLLQQLQWKLIFTKGKPKQVAQNCIVLSPPNSAAMVVLIDSFAYLEVHVEADLTICEKMCPMIKEHILRGMDISHKTLDYSIEQPHLAFFCPCVSTLSSSSSSKANDTSSRHVAKLLKDGWLRCTVDNTKTYKIDEKYTIWLKSSELELSPGVTVNKTLNDLLSREGLTEEDINKVCSEEHILELSFHLTNWELVATSLGLKAADIEAIKRNNINVETRRWNTLQKWKSSPPTGTATATYRVLLKALLRCRHSELVLRVCMLLKEDRSK